MLHREVRKEEPRFNEVPDGFKERQKWWSRTRNSSKNPKVPIRGKKGEEEGRTQKEKIFRNVARAETHIVISFIETPRATARGGGKGEK